MSPFKDELCRSLYIVGVHQHCSARLSAEMPTRHPHHRLCELCERLGIIQSSACRELRVEQVIFVRCRPRLFLSDHPDDCDIVTWTADEYANTQKAHRSSRLRDEGSRTPAGLMVAIREAKGIA